MIKKILSLTLVAVMACTMFVACTKDDEPQIKENVTVAELHTAIKNAYGEDGYAPNMPLTPEDLATIYGVEEAWVDEYVAEHPMISVNADFLVIVKASEGNKENVVNALTAKRDALLSDSFQYPMNLMKVKATQLLNIGDFVFLFTLGMMSDDVLFAEGEQEEIDQLQYEEALKNNQKAIDAIEATIYVK